MKIRGVHPSLWVVVSTLVIATTTLPAFAGGPATRPAVKATVKPSLDSEAAAIETVRAWLADPAHDQLLVGLGEHWDYAGFSRLVFGQDLRTYNIGDQQTIIDAMRTASTQVWSELARHMPRGKST